MPQEMGIFLNQLRLHCLNNQLIEVAMIRKIGLGVLLLYSVVSTASPVTPAYVPGGSVSPISLYNAMSPLPQLKGPGWWYFVGLLHDQQYARHSLQLTLFRVNFGATMYGIGAIGFTFRDSHGNTDYLWNMYPDVYAMINYPFGPLMSTPAAQSDFKLQIQADPNPLSNGFSYQFSHDPTDNLMVGQIGAQYHFTAQSVAEIGVAQNNPQYVQYQLQMTLQDQRGLLPEGYSGFVGTPFSQDPSLLKTWEMAMPNMRAVQWTMSITPMGKITPASPVQKTMTFNAQVNSSDHVWLDRQIENKGASADYLNQMVQQKIEGDPTMHVQANNMKQMYYGTWMAFCLDKKPFQNLCGDATAFWQHDVTTVQMDSDQNATSGFMNLFTPDSNAKEFPTKVGSTLTEVLTVSGAQKDLPYRIQNDANGLVQSPITKNIYDKTVTVTIRKNTLFSAILDQLSGSISHDQKYVLKFDALSGKTENVTFSNNYGYYEGAATVSLCTADKKSCQPVGTGFMEQMGYSAK